jgi:hypothetical protein
LFTGAPKGAPIFFGARMAGPKLEDKAPKDKKKRELKGTRKERITQLLGEIETNLDFEKTRVTLADFIRLMQLERELEQEEQPREIIITWKDPSERRSDSSR